MRLVVGLGGRKRSCAVTLVDVPIWGSKGGRRLTSCMEIGIGGTCSPDVGSLPFSCMGEGGCDGTTGGSARALR